MVRIVNEPVNECGMRIFMGVILQHVPSCVLGRNLEQAEFTNETRRIPLVTVN
jgi:hypothetical protein